MILGSPWVKQPYEIEPITVDFTKRLGTGETLTDATVTAKNADTGVSASEILAGPTVIDGGFVTRLVQGGTPGVRYLLEYKTATSFGYHLEDEVGVTVIET